MPQTDHSFIHPPRKHLHSDRDNVMLSLRNFVQWGITTLDNRDNTDSGLMTILKNDTILNLSFFNYY